MMPPMMVNQRETPPQDSAFATTVFSAAIKDSLLVSFLE
jgi:hypothetical protein